MNSLDVGEWHGTVACCHDLYSVVSFLGDNYNPVPDCWLAHYASVVICDWMCVTFKQLITLMICVSIVGKLKNSRKLRNETDKTHMPILSNEMGDLGVSRIV